MLLQFPESRGCGRVYGGGSTESCGRVCASIKRQCQSDLLRCWYLELTEVCNCLLEAVVIIATMQFYPAPNLPPSRPEYAYPAGPIATSPRMNWSPTIPAAWSPYDFAYPAAYPPTTGEPQRSPSYQQSGQDQPGGAGGTPHNIRDILGAESGATLPNEVAKTYHKLPTSSGIGMTQFSRADHARSPTTPNTPHFTSPNRPFEGIVYSEVPRSFYVPAIPSGLPGTIDDPCLHFGYKIMSQLCLGQSWLFHVASGHA